MNGVIIYLIYYSFHTYIDKSPLFKGLLIIK